MSIPTIASRLIKLPTYVDVDAAIKSFRDNDFEQLVLAVRTWKLRDDLARYERTLEVGRPEVVVECGTAWGGSALWFAQHDVDVITIDVNDSRSAAARALPNADRVTWLVGSTTAVEVVRKVESIVDGRRAMVALDSDHHYQHVKLEIQSYAPMVSPGCYLVVEDGIFDLMPPIQPYAPRRISRQGGPLLAVQRTVATRPDEWLRDVDLECLTPITHDPAGWWRRRG